MYFDMVDIVVFDKLFIGSEKSTGT